jgi:hypothetical protein
MDARQLAALELAARAKITWTGKHWLVPSMSGTGNYRVDAGSKCCTCDNFELTGKPCKHILAVDIVRKRDAGLPVPELPKEDEKPKRKRPTYSQDWPNYNKAQTNEKRLFQVLLADLCGTLEDPPAKTGRPRIPLRDAMFAAVFKVYSTVSGRRFVTDLQAAREVGHIGTAPHYNSVFRVFDLVATFRQLKRLIALSAVPLRAVETTFAADSSGFSTNRFGRWFDAKYGVDRTEAAWVKCHLMCGVNTHIVTAVELGKQHDGQMLPDLHATTADTFTVDEVCADKAYLSREILELIDGAGGVPLIPFKVNSKPDKNGEVWEKLYHHFALRRDEFLARYHQRSNVESVFSMVKRKFGDGLRSKSFLALQNEALAKILCHNLVVLVHEMYEHGIVADFSGRVEEEVEEESPRIIRFPGA